MSNQENNPEIRYTQAAQQALEVEQCRELLEKDITILDTRHPEQFAEGFVPGSIFIGPDERMGHWAASLLPLHRPVLLIADSGREAEAARHLVKSGFTHFAGFLRGGFEAWQQAGQPVDLLITVEADELAMDLPFDTNLLPLDVRSLHEFAAGHIKGALNIPLNDFNDPAILAGLEEEHNLYVYSGNGYRSVIACSLLKREGIQHLRNVSGGWEKISQESRIPVEKDGTVLN